MIIFEVLSVVVISFQTCLILRLLLPIFPLGLGTVAAAVHSFVFRATEPVVAPLRRVLPPLPTNGFGLTELILLMLSGLIAQFLHSLA